MAHIATDVSFNKCSSSAVSDDDETTLQSTTTSHPDSLVLGTKPGDESSYQSTSEDCSLFSIPSESCSILIPSFSPPAPPAPPQFYTYPTVEDIVLNLPTILSSLVPYTLFLIVFALNPFINVLMTVDDVTWVRDVGGCLTLYNVSSWESHVTSFSVHRLVSSLNCTALDLISTVPYMVHYVIPILFPVYLAMTNRIEYISKFFKLLGVTMWIQYFIWYHLPTAPPWSYSDDVTALQPAAAAAASDVMSVSLQLLTEVTRTLCSSATSSSSSVLASRIDLSHREGAAFARVDAFVGVSFFFRMFSGNPVPFAAFPSGHVAWPTCMLMTAPPGGRLRFTAYVLLVTWATLYTSHHYLLDALAAVGVVLLAYWVLKWSAMHGHVRSKVVRSDGNPLDMHHL